MAYPPYQQDFLEPGTRRVSKPWHAFFLSLVGGSGGIDGGAIAPGSVPLDALAPIDAPRLLGRESDGMGPVEELLIGTGLVLADQTLSVTAESLEQIGYWTLITNGDSVSPEPLYDAEGDAVMGFVPTP